MPVKNIAHKKVSNCPERFNPIEMLKLFAAKDRNSGKRTNRTTALKKPITNILIKQAKIKLIAKHFSRVTLTIFLENRVPIQMPKIVDAAAKNFIRGPMGTKEPAKLRASQSAIEEMKPADGPTI